MYILKNYLGNRYEFNFKIIEKYSNNSSYRLKVSIYNFKINEKYQDDTFGYIKIVNNKGIYMLEIEIFDSYQNLIVDLKLNEYRENEEEIVIFDSKIALKSKNSNKIGVGQFQINKEFQIVKANIQDYPVADVESQTYNHKLITNKKT
ncbi:hypothetical protein [Clostridium thermobutyricum]|uniref:hypothetical protein n=1 Tax=Clostridium thermobutyricum TaxID=29372 RepID=UPI0018AA3D2B|nr:hypothetical protein [Clostridium thermobutyricum]